MPNMMQHIKQGSYCADGKKLCWICQLSNRGPTVVMGKIRCQICQIWCNTSTRGPIVGMRKTLCRICQLSNRGPIVLIGKPLSQIYQVWKTLCRICQVWSNTSNRTLVLMGKLCRICQVSNRGPNVVMGKIRCQICQIWCNTSNRGPIVGMGKILPSGKNTVPNMPSVMQHLSELQQKLMGAIRYGCQWQPVTDLVAVLLYQQAIGFSQGQGRCCASGIAVTSHNADAKCQCIVFTIFTWNKTKYN